MCVFTSGPCQHRIENFTRVIAAPTADKDTWGLRNFSTERFFSYFSTTRMMMQEVGNNDSNGEAAYDFVSDAKKSSPPLLPPGTSIPSSLTSSTSSSVSSSSTPVYAPPGSLASALPTGQKPSYAYPPGLSGGPASSGRSPGGPPPNFTPTAPPSIPHHAPPTVSASDTLTDISNVLKSSSISPSRQGTAAGGAPDLQEIFGSNLMSQLPPLQQKKLPLLTSPPPPPLSASTFATPPSTAASFQPRNPIGPPPAFPSATGVTGGVNPFSSQAAAGHLPSFSAFQPLPTLEPQWQPQNQTLSPFPPTFGPPRAAVAPPPVAMMSLPATTTQTLPGPNLNPASSGTHIQSELSQSLYTGSGAPPPPYGQPPYQMAGSVSFDTTSLSGGYGGHAYVGGMSPPHYAGQSGPGDMSHSGNRSWWMQSSFDALKNVTEKAKSTAFSLMNTLDPQMKQFAGASASGGGGELPLAGELTLFYIGNETNLLDALKSGAEGFYKSIHIYTRSGTAPGHKQQIGFKNALAAATATINLARSAPQLQNSLLLAVEPFVVELSPGLWYVGTCLVLSDVLTQRGDYLHTFSQLTLLTDFSLSLAAPGEEQLAAPLDDLISDRSSLMLRRDNWMDQLTGVSFASTVAFAARQLFGIYKRRHM
ncbi:hypothetical protein BV898_05316 [Hypsibius exemplaris]|uniref:Protein PRRC1 n=1 Tax=Hypsibius exemplaris TaxID=2072580 RepID=A0A1W0WZT6_HYPEX|nr:hypothetical protein BV898_05316 [Hypsibius exemplaris]